MNPPLCQCECQRRAKHSTVVAVALDAVRKTVRWPVKEKGIN